MNSPAAAAAARFLLLALGANGGRLALAAFRADWLSPTEAAKLEPVARALAAALNVELPTHHTQK